MSDPGRLSCTGMIPDPDDEPTVPLENLEKAADLLLPGKRPDQPREPVSSR